MGGSGGTHTYTQLILKHFLDGFKMALIKLGDGELESGPAEHRLGLSLNVSRHVERW